jgi:uncharacterized protein
MVPKNVLGELLVPCSKKPITGYFRNGYCDTCPEDFGKHTVCIEATDEFLEFSKLKGNDLSTPMPEYQFPGVKAGERWCLCAMRWVEAYKANMAPKLVLEATHESMLELVPLEVLQEFDANEI